MTPQRAAVLLFNLLIGAGFAAATMTVLSPAVASLHFVGGDNDALILVFWGLGALIAAFVGLAPTIRRGFGRGFLFLGSGLLALPISAFMLSGRAFVETVDPASPASALGAGIAAGFVTGVAALLGLVFGTIFLVAGLVLSLGGRREVIVVNLHDGTENLRAGADARDSSDTRLKSPVVRREPPLR